MNKPPSQDADVIDFLGFKSAQQSGAYDSSKVERLEGLEPVRERNFTIAGTDALSAEQIEFFLQALRRDRDLWVIEITNVRGEKARIYRGNPPPDRWPSKR